MREPFELADRLIATWRTNNRITTFFIERIPEDLWIAKVPGYSRKTIRMIAGHLHNARCMWIKATSKRDAVAIPEHVDKHRLTQKDLVQALEGSSRCIIQILENGLARGGRISGFSPGDVVHFATYLMTHESHHRGQICMAARQLGFDLTGDVVNGIWQWSKRSKEAENDR